MARQSAAVQTRESDPSLYLHELTHAAWFRKASFALSIQLATCPLSIYLDKSPCNSFKSLYRRFWTASVLLPVLHCPWRYIQPSRKIDLCQVEVFPKSSQRVARDRLFFAGETHPRVQDLLDLSFIKADVGSTGAELADDPSKLCCLVIIVRMSIDNDMERAVTRHLPKAGSQSHRRFGALQIHQHPMPFFAPLFQIANRTDLRTCSQFRNKLRRFLAGFRFGTDKYVRHLRF